MTVSRSAPATERANPTRPELRVGIEDFFGDCMREIGEIKGNDSDSDKSNSVGFEKTIMNVLNRKYIGVKQEIVLTSELCCTDLRAVLGS
jgi:hypothetical protein